MPRWGLTAYANARGHITKCENWLRPGPCQEHERIAVVIRSILPGQDLHDRRLAGVELPFCDVAHQSRLMLDPQPFQLSHNNLQRSEKRRSFGPPVPRVS